MIKNIIFDMGNVLINYDFEIFFGKLGFKAGERSLDEASKPITQFECGNIGTDEFLVQLADIYRSNLNSTEFRLAWCDVFWENSELIGLARGLSEQYRLMIFSNNDELHFPYIWDKYPSLWFFDEEDIMITSRLGYIKPDPQSYSKASTKHLFNWEESVFIDDNNKNLIIAKRYGAHTIWHCDNKKTIQCLKAALA